MLEQGRESRAISRLRYRLDEAAPPHGILCWWSVSPHGNPTLSPDRNRRPDTSAREKVRVKRVVEGNELHALNNAADPPLDHCLVIQLLPRIVSASVDGKAPITGVLHCFEIEDRRACKAKMD
jgi:hypothetical protein